MDNPALKVSAAVEAAYTSALEGCLVVEHEPPGVLVARGSSTLDLLHRMSTNDMNGLKQGEIRATVLTTAIGRIVDVIHVLRREDDFLLLTSQGRSGTVREWLARHIFFNDDLVLSEAIPAYRLWGLYGPTAAAEADGLSSRASASALPTYSSLDDGYLWASAGGLSGFRLLAGAELQRRAEDRWGERGPGTPYAEAFEAHRIEQGQPAPGHEIRDDVIPLEAGLWHLVSFDKGCYIGQEVIARMESRSRIARQLAGLQLEQNVSEPQEIERDGAPLGRLTSTAFSPRLGTIGLGLVRSAALETAPAPVRLSPSGASATLLRLPFEPLAA